MSIPSSPGANLPLPLWAYVPGETADAEADHDTLWQAKALVPSRFRDYVPARHPALRYGMALNDRGYFWEAQEILEAVWAAAPQGGRERILLRACIQIANANLKLRMEKPRAAARLHHTNIVPVFGVGEQDGLHYFVMQFIQGLGLDEVLAELSKEDRAQAEAAARKWLGVR